MLAALDVSTVVFRSLGVGTNAGTPGTSYVS